MITSITVSFKRTQSLPGYCNVSSGLTVTADVPADEDHLVVEQRLRSELEQSVNDWIDAALEQAGQPARFSAAPRYDLLWWRSAELALIAPHIPPMHRDELQSLPGDWRYYVGEDDACYTNQHLANLKRMTTDIGLQYRPEFLTIDELREWVQSHLTLTGLWSIVGIAILDPVSEWEYLGRIAIPGEVYAQLATDPCLEVELASISGSVGIRLSDIIDKSIPTINTAEDASLWIQEQILRPTRPRTTTRPSRRFDE